MNFNSKILKLSIIIMLVLVLVPVVAAENSTDTFYVEYDAADDEVYVEEYGFSEYSSDYSDAQESSYTHEVEVESDNDYGDQLGTVDESIKMNDDDVNILIAEEKSALEPQDIVVNDEEESTVSLMEDVEFPDINENAISECSDDECILDSESIKISYNIPVFEFNVLNKLSILLNDIILCNTTSFKTTGYHRSLVKNLDLKNLVLNDDLACMGSKYVDGVVIMDLNDQDYNDKFIGDFAYSIDNSIIGDEEFAYLFPAYFSYFDTFCNNDFYLTFDDFCGGFS